MSHLLCVRVPFSPLGPGYPLSPFGPGPPGGPEMVPYAAKAHHSVVTNIYQLPLHESHFLLLLSCNASLRILTSEERHEVSRDVAIGTDDAALTGRSGGARWTGRALDCSHIRPQRALNQILLQQALI